MMDSVVFGTVLGAGIAGVFQLGSIFLAERFHHTRIALKNRRTIEKSEDKIERLEDELEDAMNDYKRHLLQRIAIMEDVNKLKIMQEFLVNEISRISASTNQQRTPTQVLASAREELENHGLSNPSHRVETARIPKTMDSLKNERLALS